VPTLSVRRGCSATHLANACAHHRTGGVPAQFLMRRLPAGYRAIPDGLSRWDIRRTEPCTFVKAVYKTGQGTGVCGLLESQSQFDLLFTGVVVVETAARFDAQPSAVHVMLQQLPRSFRNVLANGGIVLFNREHGVKPYLVHEAEGT